MKPRRSACAQLTTAALLTFVALAIEGCSGPASVSTPTTPQDPATLIYVRGNESTTVLGYPANATGDISPTTTLLLPAGFYIDTIATDFTGQIYVGVQGSDVTISEILVYPAGSNGSATPTRIITVPISIYPWVMSIDAAGLLYVATQAEDSTPPVVNVYSATANGPSTPIRTINLPAGGPIGINDTNVDAAGNIYVVTASTVSNNMVIEVFGPTAYGLAKPSRTIVADGNISGVSVDAAGDIFANVSVGSGSVSTSVIEEFAPAANGQAIPVNIIELAQPSEFLRLDAAGNIYTSLQLGPDTFQVQGFSPGATQNAAPFASFTAVGGIAQEIAPN